ncbi:hypothetical protein D3C72_1039820 [compost metagenome]
MGNFAAKRDGVTWSFRIETRASFLDLRGNGKIAHAVRRFRQLPHDPVGAFESLMDIPKRTGRPETGKLQPRGAVAFGNVAGAVDLGEKDRHAFHARALQGAQPVGHLLKARAEAHGEKLQIVTQFLSRPMKLPIGQDEGCGEIIVQSDTTDFRRFHIAESGTGQHPVHRRAGVKLGDLQCKLKTAGRRGHVGAESERFAGGVEMPDQPACRLRSCDMDAVTVAQMRGQNAVGLAAFYLQFFRQLFGQKVDLGDVIVDEVEEIAHLLIGGSFHLRGSAAQPVIQLHQLLAVLAIGLMGAQQRMGKTRRVLGDQFQFLKARFVVHEERIFQRLTHGGNQPVAFARRQFRHIKLEFFHERHQNAGRNRALIVFDLVQVARGDAQPLGKLRLRGAGVFAKAAHLAADEEFFRRHIATLQN